MPAPAYLPLNLKEVGIIDRTLVVEKHKTLDDIDKILSAEGKNLDKEGASSTVQGLYNELSKNPNINQVILIENTDLRSPGLGVFPAALTWDEVNTICNLNGVNALFELSFYDTDAKISYSSTPSNITNPLGIKIPSIEHTATINTLIKMGFRIYDPVNEIIRDEVVITQNIVSQGVGINPMKAAEAILNRKQMLVQKSNYMGQEYGLRILPYKTRVNRDYYVNGSDNFKIGKRRALTGDWNGAAELWAKEIDNSKMKIAGRAHYNMANISEIKGNLNKAVQWASKSYTDYNNNKALSYVNILKNRIALNNQLKIETEE